MSELEEARVVGTLTPTEYKALAEELTVDPTKYTKRFRLYVDVDGVVMPDFLTMEQYEVMDSEAYIETISLEYWTEPAKITRSLFVYNKKVAEKLSEWSHRDDVDFVWVTAWRENAPYALDSLLNVKSVGFLPWAKKMSDYTQVFKEIAIEEDQQENPSKFVWIDDIAIRPRYKEIPVFTEGEYEYDYIQLPDAKYDDFIGDYEETAIEKGFVVTKERIPAENYLTVIPKSTVGLTDSEMDTIDRWLNTNS